MFGYSTSWTTKNHGAVPFNASKKAKNSGRLTRESRSNGMSDEVILGVLRAHLIEGLTKQAAADRFDVLVSSAEGWFKGYNKGHLLDQVMRELSALR